MSLIAAARQFFSMKKITFAPFNFENIVLYLCKNFVDAILMFDYPFTIHQNVI